MDYIEFKLWKLLVLCVLAFFYGMWQMHQKYKDR